MKFATSMALLAGLSLLSTAAFATPAIAKKEAKKCTVCHTAMGKKDLNDAGKYYKEHKKLPAAK